MLRKKYDFRVFMNQNVKTKAGAGSDPSEETRSGFKLFQNTDSDSTKTPGSGSGILLEYRGKNKNKKRHLSTMADTNVCSEGRGKKLYLKKIVLGCMTNS